MIANNRPSALVMGLGKSGYSCARYLHRLGYAVEVTDTRAQPPMLNRLKAEHSDISFVPGSVALDHMYAFDLVVTSPGLSIHEGVIADFINEGGRVVGDIEIFANHAKAPIIAITGANGKSTVTDLVGYLLSTSLDVLVGGNIGTPALDLLEKDVPDVYVLELSSFQLETTYNLDARAAVVLNISEDHMDRYRDIEDYARSKQRIYSGTGVMVLNRDDAHVMAMRRPERVTRLFTVGVPESEMEYGIAMHNGEEWLMNGERPLVPVSEIRLAGRHNQTNVLAALALIEDFNLPYETIRKGIASYAGLPHRCQIVAEFNGVQWINDSKATNVGATTAALKGIDRPVILIAGGEGKDADFSPLAEAVHQGTKKVILIGRDAKIIEQAIGRAVEVEHASDMADAIERAAAVSTPGDAVLLSPACASFDMFDNFEHRGSVFTQLVQARAERQEERL
jgi:UDP-N-acetylmuramoylalanine--D-glutamate ligase